MARRSQIVISKVYTRTGDKGETALVGGARVPKDSLRIEAYGTVDELNATLALVLEAARPDAAQDELRRLLLQVQNELFDLGSELATPPDQMVPGMPVVTAAAIKRMERTMDRCNLELVPLRSFVLPGGGPVASALHLSRTVCRRAEREVLRLSRQEAVRPETLKYLNRLSDLLFVLSRWSAHRSAHAEVLWQPLQQRDDL